MKYRQTERRKFNSDKKKKTLNQREQHNVTAKPKREKYQKKYYDRAIQKESAPRPRVLGNGYVRLYCTQNSQKQVNRARRYPKNDNNAHKHEPKYK